MVYLVTTQEELFENELYTIISADKALKMMQSWDVIQVDSETNGRDPHLCDFLCFQFGNKVADTQIVVDCSCVDIKLYKNLLESKFLIGQNLKFDLQFLYKYGIVPRNVYDTMIVEQLLYLGYPYVSLTPEEYKQKQHTFPYKINDDTKSLNYGNYELSFALNALGLKYCGMNIDKTVRGEIIWRGLDSKVIEYAAGDVKYLEDIWQGQMQAVKRLQYEKGVQLENACVPVMAYLEWCGIKLDETKWKAKMTSDKANLDKAEKALTQYAVKHPKLQKWVTVDLQGDLFSGFNTDPIWTVDWQKKEVAQVVKALGFNTTTVSKQTKQEGDSVMEKVLAPQKGVDDTFLELYFKYQGYYKVCSSFGQGHLDAINPVTGRIHTVYKQLGAASSRMSCGSSQPNTDLEKYKKLPKGSCKYPNIQQLPHDAETRSCFVAEPENNFCSCDYSAQEGRVQAEIYNEKVLLDIYNKNLDSHSVNAKIFFKEELANIAVEDVKKLRPDLRQAAKAPFFALKLYLYL